MQCFGLGAIRSQQTRGRARGPSGRQGGPREVGEDPGKARRCRPETDDGSLQADWGAPSSAAAEGGSGSRHPSAGDNARAEGTVLEAGGSGAGAAAVQ